jgi:class 3 adenylate cyclase
VRVRLLGQFVVTAGDRVASSWPRPSARRLCELVLVSPGRRISRDLACDELFPGRDPRAAARSLSKALSMARGVLTQLGEPTASLLAADLGHIWVSSDVEVDAEVLEQELRAGLAMAPGQHRDDRLTAALADDAELLADEPYADWAERPRERLTALRQEARLALARDRAAGAGRAGPDDDDVVAAWQSCLDHDPACEEAAGALVRAYFARGRPELAARVFERCRAALEELGLRISPSLEKVHAAVAREPDPPAPVVTAAAPAPAPSPSPAPREERRPVSVLFAEVAAPAGLAGTLGLERLREVVGGLLAAVITEVEALGGTVTSVSGRGLQAMFGAPEAHEDDPERAVLAAFRALMAAGGAADGATALRIGVETGPAVVGPVGGGAKVEYGAFGDVVSVAAALQSSARPASVLVGPVTRAAVDHLFTWGGGEEVALGRNLRPLVAGYLEAPRTRGPGRPRRPGLGGSAPLAGRETEMEELSAALRDAVRGRGSLVMVTGEPGLGKTRLVQECRKRFIAWVGAGSGRLPLWLEGRCASYASATPYGLYQQLVASWVGVAADQPAARLLPAVESALATLMGNTNLLPLLASMLGIPHPSPRGRMGPGELQRMTFGAMRSVVSRLAVAGPTVLVLEDLHWADPTSLRLTLDLARLAAERPLLVLATSRPDTDLGGLLDVPAARQVVLRPLLTYAAKALARSLIGEDVGQEVLDAVLASAEGNPLFLEERLSSLLETRTLVRERGTWRLRETAGPQLPQALERLVRSRVDRLSTAAQEAIRAASVLGTGFPASLLADVMGNRPGVSLEPVMDELCASDLLHPEISGGREPAFRFRHALIQEATYLGMLGAERRELHARAAAALEAAAVHHEPGRLAAVLGRHFAAAGDAERAVPYLEMAGDRATDGFANDEAVSSYRAALAVVRRQRGAAATVVRLHAKLANVLWRTARRDEAKDAFHAALRLAGSVDSLNRAYLYTRLGRLEMTEYGYQAAAEAFDAAEALLGDDPGSQDDATADQWLELMLDGRADMYSMRDELDLALAVLETARPVLEARGTPARRYTFNRVMLMHQLLRKRFRVDEADIADLRANIEVARQTGEDMYDAYAAHYLGWALWLRGDLAEAKEESEKALAMAERMGESHLLSPCLLSLTMTALRRHDTEAVRSLIPRVIAAAEDVGSSGHVAGAMTCQAWLAWQDGRPDDVIRLSAEIAELGPTSIGSGARYRWVYLLPLIAALLSRVSVVSVGSPAEGVAEGVAGAVAAARQILEPAQQRLPDDLAAVLEAACAEWDRDDPAAARQNLAAALTLARDLHFL